MCVVGNRGGEFIRRRFTFPPHNLLLQHRDVLLTTKVDVVTYTSRTGQAGLIVFGYSREQMAFFLIAWSRYVPPLATLYACLIDSHEDFHFDLVSPFDKLVST